MDQIQKPRQPPPTLQTGIQFQILETAARQSKLKTTSEPYIFSKLHILGMNAKNFKTSNFIRNTNVYFPVKPAKSPESRINTIGTICSSNNYNMSTGFQSIH
nr:hypothetical protein TorRG33x02_256950 [Ipomoea trifida]